MRTPLAKAVTVLRRHFDLDAADVGLIVVEEIDGGYREYVDLQVTTLNKWRLTWEEVKAASISNPPKE